jgi:regulator of CtrA degradation
MADRSQSESALVQFSERLTNSAAFGVLFREGMDLVEETAAYLDGDGRTEAKALERSVSLTYATESMRLTTRLMQLASWLLLHRAVKEGEMTLTQANREKTKVKLTAADPGAEDMIEKLPQQSDCALDEPADAGPPARHHDPHAACGTGADRQPAGAAAQPPEGGLRAITLSIVIASSLSLPAMTRQDYAHKKRPGEPGRFCISGPERRF